MHRLALQRTKLGEAPDAVQRLLEKGVGALTLVIG